MVACKTGTQCSILATLDVGLSIVYKSGGVGSVRRGGGGGLWWPVVGPGPTGGRSGGGYLWCQSWQREGWWWWQRGEGLRGDLIREMM